MNQLPSPACISTCLFDMPISKNNILITLSSPVIRRIIVALFYPIPSNAMPSALFDGIPSSLIFCFVS